jgi:hypothetical protein
VLLFLFAPRAYNNQAQDRLHFPLSTAKRIHFEKEERFGINAKRLITMKFFIIVATELCVS